MKNRLQYICPGLVLAFLMVLTLMPVEQRWAQTDVTLVAALPVIALVGIAQRTFTHSRMRLTAVDVAVVTWVVYYIARTWIGAEYPCRMEFLKTTVSFVLYVAVRMLPGQTVPILPYFIMVGGSVEALWGAWQMLTGSSRHGVFLVTGSLNNPGPYSAYLVMAAVAAIVMMSMETPLALGKGVRKLIKISAMTTAVVCLVMLPATWSRAAFVSLAVCLLWIYRKVYWRYRYAVWGGLAVIAVVFYYFKQGSANGRMIIWQAALASWVEEPWLGVGTDGFCHAVSEGIAKLSVTGMVDMDSAGVTNYSYNSLVSILTEHGIMGVSLCLITVSVVMWRMWNVSRAIFFAILSLLVFSLFSYPFELLPYRIVLVVCVAALGSEERKVKSEKSHPECLRDEERRMKLCYVTNFILSSIALILNFILSSIIFIPLCIISYALYMGVKDVHEADKEYATFRGMYEELFLEDYRELLPQEEDNAKFLFDYAQALRMAKRYNDSNEMLRRGAMVSADPMFYVLQGNNYKDMTLYNMAEESYKKAFAVMPNRLYPLYQLMLLYQKKSESDNKKLKDVARRIVAIKPKIESPATRDIQRAARQVLTDSPKPSM